MIRPLLLRPDDARICLHCGDVGLMPGVTGQPRCPVCTVLDRPQVAKQAVVYRVYGNGVLLYVGFTQNARERLSTHRNYSLWWPWPHRFPRITEGRITLTEFDSKRAALDAEAAAIRDEGPIYNAVTAVL